jgi:shikimate dehydrogenase
MRDRYAVIGNPVAHSLSPWIHAEFARATGEPIEYVRIEAPLDAFARTVAAFCARGGRGANVTAPFKEQAYALATARSARAEAAGAVNTLRFDDGTIFGDNTDGLGLVTDLERNLGFPIAGARILVAGAGGAARGVIGPLLERAPVLLAIANRDASRARALAARFAPARGGGYDEFADERFDLVVNATSAALCGEMPALAPGILGPGVLAYDMSYGRETPFLAAARAAGARTADGIGMLVEQAAESFFVWRGVRPGTAAVRAALRAG